MSAILGLLLGMAAGIALLYVADSFRHRERNHGYAASFCVDLATHYHRRWFDFLWTIGYPSQDGGPRQIRLRRPPQNSTIDRYHLSFIVTVVVLQVRFCLQLDRVMRYRSPLWYRVRRANGLED